MTRTALTAALWLIASAAWAAGEDPAAIARTVGEKFAEACGAGDVNSVLALYQDDARVVYPGAGQSATDKTALRHMVVQTCAKGAPKLELVGYSAVWVGDSKSVIAALGDWKATAIGPDGKPATTPVRATEVIIKTPSGWHYIVDHASFGVPAPAPETSAAQ